MIQTRKQVLQNRNYNRSECTELKTAIYTIVTLSGLVLFVVVFFLGGVSSVRWQVSVCKD